MGSPTARCNTMCLIRAATWMCGITNNYAGRGAHGGKHAVSLGSCYRAARTAPSRQLRRLQRQLLDPLQPPPGARPVSTRPPRVHDVAVRLVQRGRAVLLGAGGAQRRGAAVQPRAWAAVLRKAREGSGWCWGEKKRQGVAQCCGSACKLVAGAAPPTDSPASRPDGARSIALSRCGAENAEFQHSRILQLYSTSCTLVSARTYIHPLPFHPQSRASPGSQD